MPKLPYRKEDILRYEDMVERLVEKLRKLRERLTNGPLTEVLWQFDTFPHLINLAEAFLDKRIGDFNAQEGAAIARADRQRLKAEAKKTSKNQM